MMRHRVRGMLAAAILVAGCAGGKSTGSRLDEGPWEVTVISGEDTIAVPTESKPAPRPVKVIGVDGDTPEGAWEVSVEGGIETPARPADTAPPGDPNSPATAPPNARDYIPGYRIQILASSSMLLAEQEAAKADSLLDLPVHIEYEPPFYKVRIGDFLVREDALDALAASVRAHYDRAWVTETMVLRPVR